MGGWRYGVVRKPEHGGEEGEYYYELHEIYYSFDEEGNEVIDGHSEKAIAPFGISVEDLQDDLRNMMAGVESGIIYEEETVWTNEGERIGFAQLKRVTP